MFIHDGGDDARTARRNPGRANSNQASTIPAAKQRSPKEGERKRKRKRKMKKSIGLHPLISGTGIAGPCSPPAARAKHSVHWKYT